MDSGLELNNQVSSIYMSEALCKDKAGLGNPQPE